MSDKNGIFIMKKIFNKMFFGMKEQSLKSRLWRVILVRRFLSVMFFTLSVFNGCISFKSPEFKDIDDEADVRKVSLDVEFTDISAYFSDPRLPARVRKKLKDKDSEIPIRIYLQYLKRREIETESVSPFFPYLYYVRTRRFQHSFGYQISAGGCAYTEKGSSDYSHSVDEFRIHRPIDFISFFASWTLFTPTPNYFVGISSLAFFFSPMYLNRHQTDLFQYETELIKELRSSIDSLENKCK